MKSKALQVSFDIYMRKIGVWLMWYLVFYVFLYAGAYFVPLIINIEWGLREIEWTFVEGIRNSANVFFLISGILSMGGFLKYYISNGITRKDYYGGVVVSAVALSISLSVLVALISVVDALFFSELSTLSIVYFIQLPLELLLFYFLGWFIVAGFYKFNTWIGIIFIILAFGVVMVHGGLWGEEIQLPLFNTVIFEQQNTPVALLITIIITVILAWLVRIMTKHVRVKV
ncbi:hypothetical protein [Alkalihalobacillus pseudalcaliphilus]|uniref:hypothetical protein n=1 Tax=Alkalihalobacillus pseudalcaliphilus TaxID=79884 RepID=UPI00064DA7AF|nr:hypothetical protein [Alkalihalobacillus pseudalcaliphilus]KMK78132.1 hypothetical protein AB990_01445 [Alkalihalobacillus pseudalcaliphilus]